MESNMNNLIKFLNTMDIKLDINKDKGGWHDCDITFLLDKLQEEVNEVKDCLNQKNNRIGVLKLECADVANIAYMIFDRASRYHNTKSMVLLHLEKTHKVEQGL